MGYPDFQSYPSWWSGDPVFGNDVPLNGGTLTHITDLPGGNFRSALIAVGGHTADLDIQVDGFVVPGIGTTGAVQRATVRAGEVAQWNVPLLGAAAGTVYMTANASTLLDVTIAGNNLPAFGFPVPFDGILAYLAADAIATGATEVITLPFYAGRAHLHLTLAAAGAAWIDSRDRAGTRIALPWQFSAGAAFRVDTEIFLPPRANRVNISNTSGAPTTYDLTVVADQLP